MTRAPLRASRNVRSFTSEKRPLSHASAPYAWTTRAPRIVSDRTPVRSPIRSRADRESARRRFAMRTTGTTIAGVMRSATSVS